MTGVELRAVAYDDPAAAPLVEGLAAEYQARYGANGEMASTPPEQFRPPAGLFVVAVDDGVTVAGGGFRPHAEGVCEVKRMWTAPTHRRRGLAALVLTTLEQRAAAAGYRTLVLETGPRQPEAAAFYAGRGYRRIDPFGPYPQALAFEVDLAAAPGTAALRP